MTTSQADGQTTFTLGGSIPLDVAATLMSLVGHAYPSTRVSSDHRGMTFHIDNTERVTDPGVFERAAQLKVEADEFSLDTYLTSLGAGGVDMSLPEILARQMVTLVEGVFADQGPEVNYLETQLTSRTDERLRWAVIVARSTTRTPHELRQAAEQRADRAEAEVARLTALLPAATTEEPS